MAKLGEADTASFVQWFRSAAPYIHAFRGKTFVLAFGGDALADGGAKKEKAKDAFARLDVDASGSLSLEEFVAAREGEKAERAKRIFAKIDADADGSVTKDEFKAGAKHRAEMKD